jgi:very-short-patch-repair endonuclease
MGVIQEASRKPSFYDDIKEYGKHGEEVFLAKEKHKLEAKGYTIFNVTDDKVYQQIDVDFVIDKQGASDLPPILQVIDNERYVTVEVKLDTRAIETGNLPYEVISHENLGWCCVTKCQFVYYVLTDSTGEIVVDTLWIEKALWDMFCADRSNKKKLNYIVGEKVVDLLCKIDDLRNYGAIK